MKGNDLRPGMIIIFEDDLYRVTEAVHKTPGNKRAFMQVKMSRLKDGIQRENKFSSTEDVEKAFLQKAPMQFLYQDNDGFHFMNTENYEQTVLSGDLLGNTVNYLQENLNVDVTFHEQTPVGVELPQAMEFKVVEAEPGIKKATASASFKQATIETGLSVKVPQFIEAGDMIRVNTETNEYLDRVKK